MKRKRTRWDPRRGARVAYLCHSRCSQLQRVQVKMTVEQLQRDGWPSAEQRDAGQQARFETLFAEVTGVVVGFALFFSQLLNLGGHGRVLGGPVRQARAQGQGSGDGIGTRLHPLIVPLARVMLCHASCILHLQIPACTSRESRTRARTHATLGCTLTFSYAHRCGASRRLRKSEDAAGSSGRPSTSTNPPFPTTRINSAPESVWRRATPRCPSFPACLPLFCTPLLLLFSILLKAASGEGACAHVSNAHAHVH